jgi:hypothetical protein
LARFAVEDGTVRAPLPISSCAYAPQLQPPVVSYFEHVLSYFEHVLSCFEYVLALCCVCIDTCCRRRPRARSDASMHAREHAGVQAAVV